MSVSQMMSIRLLSWCLYGVVLFLCLQECHGIHCVCPGTERARGQAQTLLNVPYGEGDGEKLDVYIPNTNSLGTNTCDRRDTNSR